MPWSERDTPSEAATRCPWKYQYIISWHFGASWRRRRPVAHGGDNLRALWFAPPNKPRGTMKVFYSGNRAVFLFSHIYRCGLRVVYITEDKIELWIQNCAYINNANLFMFAIYFLSSLSPPRGLVFYCTVQKSNLTFLLCCHPFRLNIMSR